MGVVLSLLNNRYKFTIIDIRRDCFPGINWMGYILYENEAYLLVLEAKARVDQFITSVKIFLN